MRTDVIEAAKRELIETIRLSQDALKGLCAISEHARPEPLNGTWGHYPVKACNVPVKMKTAAAMPKAEKRKVLAELAGAKRPGTPVYVVRAKAAPAAVAAGSKLLERALLLGTMLTTFTAGAVQGVLGCDWKMASNWITQALLKKWIERVEPGLYRKTEQYPKGKTGTGNLKPEVLPASAGKPGMTREELEEQIQLSCRLRDSARGKGQEELAEKHQGMVDQLEARLEKMER